MSANTARGVALEALTRIERDGAYANLALGPLLDRSGMSQRDKAFATELTYGTTRMRRACDWAVDRHVQRELDPDVRNLLRLGAFQILFLGVAPHAAVSATVAEAPARARGIVNAVLRRVSESVPVDWPSTAVELSYPDWIVDRLIADLGEQEALAALAKMNEAPSVTERPDGYVQDVASQWVADSVGARPDERVYDLCAAPGGKTTLMAERGATIVATDVHAARAGLVAGNAQMLGLDQAVSVAVADARRPPLRVESADRVLVDAPCSGLGVLRRRADARWRIDPDAVEELALLQRDILSAAWDLLRPGGRLAYSVCTLTTRETTAVATWFAKEAPGAKVEPPLRVPWRVCEIGAQLLPQDQDTDGMYFVTFRKTGGR